MAQLNEPPQICSEVIQLPLDICVGGICQAINGNGRDRSLRVDCWCAFCSESVSTEI